MPIIPTCVRITGQANRQRLLISLLIADKGAQFITDRHATRRSGPTIALQGQLLFDHQEILGGLSRGD